MESPPRPPPREFFLHPDAKRLQALPGDQFIRQMLEQLSVQSEREVPDFERCWGLGQLAAALRVDGVEQALESWLVDHDSATGHDAASLLLHAYWMKQSAAAPALVSALVDGLNTYRNAPGMRDSAVLALAAAQSRVDSTLATRIRDAFLRIRSTERDFQPSVQSALSSVIGPDDPHPGTAPPAENHAYACRDGDREYFVVERAPSAVEILRVRPPRVSGRSLLVEFEAKDTSITDSDAVRMIFELVLSSLLRDVYRGQADTIRYVNTRSGWQGTTPYGAHR